MLRIPTALRTKESKQQAVEAVAHPGIQMRSCSILSFIASMVDLSCDASFVVIEQAMTGRETPQARPRAILLKIRVQKTI
jgi:hypothetical protein